MTTETWVLRDHLLELADVLAVVLEDHLRDDQAEIIDIVRLRIIWVESQMYRRQGIRPRAPNKSPPITAELRQRMRVDALAHPELTQQEIASRHGVNSSGRVNEALNGKLISHPRKWKRPGLTDMPDNDTILPRPI